MELAPLKLISYMCFLVVRAPLVYRLNPLEGADVSYHCIVSIGLGISSKQLQDYSSCRILWPMEWRAFYDGTADV